MTGLRRWLSGSYPNPIAHRMAVAVHAVLLAACGSDSPQTPTAPSGGAPSGSTTGVSVSVPSPVRMGQTAQATGSETLSSGQSRPISAGWLSDAPAVASVTGTGLVRGLTNGRATIYVVVGGRQGQQVLRVLPDYQGSWIGSLQTKGCSETGVFDSIDFCDQYSAGDRYIYRAGFEQSEELLTATVDYGSILGLFQPVTAPVLEDGRSTFRSTLGYTSQNVTFLLSTTFDVNSVQVGILTGTAEDSWRVPGLSGEGRVSFDLVDTVRFNSNRLSGLPSGQREATRPGPRWGSGTLPSHAEGSNGN